MKIIVDAFGGDNAPKAMIEGALSAREKWGIDIILSGNREEIEKCATDNNFDLSGVEILNAESVISMHDDPKCVIKSKSDSSMSVGLKAVSDGLGDGFISAGSTAALVVGSTFIVKRIKGVKRAALGSALPTVEGKQFFLMDEGANADCRPEMLLQFGIMASVYAENVMGIKNPRVALLNIGTEDTKGGELQLAAYELLKNSDLNFIGNVEARDLMFGACDVAVSDGFSGNICLKMAEGTASAILKMLKTAFTKNLKTKIAAALVMPELSVLKKTMDYKEIGGAPIVGVKKPVYKAHGNSDSVAFCNAIGKLKVAIETDTTAKLEEKIKSLKENDEE